MSGEDSAHEPPGTYYGATLASQLGGARPNRSSIRSLECSRINPRSTKTSDPVAGDKSGNNCSRPTSAQSRVTTSRSRATSAKSIATSMRSDIVSVATRGNSTRGKLTSARSHMTSARSHVTSTDYYGWESTRNSSTCASSLIRPMGSLAVTGAPSSSSRRSLRSRKRSSCSVTSTAVTSRTGDSSLAELSTFYLGLSVWHLE
ncbi:hypothetical protein EGW08_014056, partial [Elysia chlorotica]